MSEADSTSPAAPANPTASIATPQLHVAHLPHVPRLSIRYLFAWTGVTAIVLGWMQTRGGIGSLGETTIFVLMLRTLFAAVAGWLLFGTLLIGWHKLRRTGWALEPGEWLILVLTNLLAIFFANHVLDEHILPGEITAVFLAAAIALRRRPLWCAVMIVPAIGFMSIYLTELEVFRRLELGFIFWIAMWIIVPQLATLGLLIAAEVRDRVQPRHWLHWSGTITSLLLLWFSIVITIGSIH